ncbi:membrane protein insertion efficiency factor YidD [Candidatus Poribacteria bacterium]|nr:membrane protein insertion efficiency factor YidD [Candidatus Poribacteria bacterium]
MKNFLVKLIKMYQKFLSPFLPSSCRFNPTCSQYTIDAIEKYGLFKGLKLGVLRILRCNPFCNGGYDPVK